MRKQSEADKLLQVWMKTIQRGSPVVLNGVSYPVILGPWKRRFAVIGPSFEGIDTVEVIPLDAKNDEQKKPLHIVKDYFPKKPEDL